MPRRVGGWWLGLDSVCFATLKLKITDKAMLDFTNNLHARSLLPFVTKVVRASLVDLGQRSKDLMT